MAAARRPSRFSGLALPAETARLQLRPVRGPAAARSFSGLPAQFWIASALIDPVRVRVAGTAAWGARSRRTLRCRIFGGTASQQAARQFSVASCPASVSAGCREFAEGSTPARAHELQALVGALTRPRSAPGPSARLVQDFEFEGQRWSLRHKEHSVAGNRTASCRAGGRTVLARLTFFMTGAKIKPRRAAQHSSAYCFFFVTLEGSQEGGPGR